MGFNLDKKKSFRILLISGILIILGVFVIFNYSQILKWWEVDFEGAEAGTSDNVRGWAWGENMGWISMNCYNDFTSICSGGSNNGESCNSDDDCPDGACVKDGTFENCCSGGLDCPEALKGDGGTWQNDYGITYVNTSSGNYIDDALMGYAWSDKVGWICFGKSCKCADCRICSGGSNNGESCNSDDDCVGGICGCIDHITCTGCPEECSNVKPPHGWPFPWACVGRPTWVCSNDDNQICSNDDQCGGENDSCIFSCSGDGDEDFLDISVQGAPCYSVGRGTLKAHWTMNTISVLDSSNNTNNGTLMPVHSPPVLANGKFENALEFDGKNDYIEVLDSDSLSIPRNLTIEAWVKRGAIGSEQTIIGKWDEAINGKSYRLWFDKENKLNFSVADTYNNEATITQLKGICFGYEGDGSDSCKDDAYCVARFGKGVFCRNPLITDTTKWHHIAGKYLVTIGTNTASLQLFVDGARVNVSSTGTPPDSLSDKNNDLYIGTKKGSSEMNTYFNGIIDNISIWSCGGSATFVSGRSAKDIWNDAKMEVSGWAKVVSLGDGGWLKLKGFTKAGKVWGLYLDDYDTFYTIGGYMANRYADTSMDTTGLVANWLMDEASWVSSTGFIPVADSSPSGNNDGIAHGAVPNTQGIFNSAGEFDGVDYIEVFDNATLDFTDEDDFTIQFWVKPNSFDNTSTIVAKQQGVAAGYEVQITADGYISWYLSDGINSEESLSTDLLILNAWNHVAVVFDRGEGTITRYLDGDVTGTIDNFGSVSNLSNGLSLYIGGRHLDGTAYFNGLIDNVSIYNVARTATQILADYGKHNPYCVGWDDYDHGYGDPPAPFDFEITEINNTDGGCYQLLVHWDISTWAESYTYWRCDGEEEAGCDTCGYTERNVLGGACDILTGKCSLQDSGLSENTGYCYKIQAHNETGSTYNSDGPEWKSTTLCSPEIPTIDDDTCGEIILTWGWDPTGSSDGYNIYNSLSSGENFGIISHIGEGMDYTGLVAQWKMNETSWDDTEGEVRDSSNQTPANHGRAKNSLTTTSAGKFDYAGDFDGNDDYIDCGSSNNLEVSTATIQAWVKRDSVDTRDVIITDNKTSEFDKDHFLRWEIVEGASNDDKLAIIFGDETDSVQKYSTGTINDTDWHHVAVVRDDSAETITFYIDGEAESEQSYYDELNTICSGGNNPGDPCDSDLDCDEGTCVGVIISLGNDDLWIGSSNENDMGPFHGLIDNVVIYNVARTAEQIKLDYEAGNCGYDDCSLSGECHIQGEDTNCGYALGDEDNCENCPNYVCHVQGNPDGNCGSTVAGDDSICCYIDKRILPYVNYYYKTTATSEAGESPFSDCNWGEPEQPACPSGVEGSCCPWGNTICFPPVETEEE